MPIKERIKKVYKEKKDFIWLFVILVAAFYIISGPAPRYFAGGVAETFTAKSLQMETPAMAEAISYDYGRGYEVGYTEAEKRIRKTAYLNLEVEKESYDDGKKQIESIIDQNEGFYISKNEYKDSWQNAEYRTYFVSFKVPKENFDSAIEQLKKTARLQNINIQAEDLTTYYEDLDAELESEKAVKKKIQDLLDKATEIEDIIQIEEKLSEIQKRIDDIQRQLINIERQTEYSQISITLQEKRDIPSAIEEMTGIKELIRNAIKSFDSLFVLISRLFGYAVAVLIIWLGYKGYKKIRS